MFDPPLDAGIKKAVEMLSAASVETFESCEGGAGHAYPEPTVRFHGDRSEGFRALAVARRGDQRVLELRRVWPLSDGEPTGPWWELTFSRADDTRRKEASRLFPRGGSRARCCCPCFVLL